MSTTNGVPAPAISAVVEQALRAAIRAPSPHNTQPWRFEVTDTRIDLWLDPARVLPVADPDGREARLGCGAALYNAQLALRVAGRAIDVAVVPDRARPDHLGTVRIVRNRPPTASESSLAGAIARRSTNRNPFLDRPVPSWLRKDLRAAAQADGATLHLLAHPELATLADLLRQADHLLTTDPAYQAELRAWITDQAGRDDGVPRAAGGPRPIGGSFLALRDFASDESTGERHFEQEPLVAVLSTGTDTIAHQVWAGMAMQHVLLAATAAGLSASFLSQPVELPMTRAGLRALIGGHEHPQTVLRLGYGYTVAQTPRRPVHAVTTVVPAVGRS